MNKERISKLRQLMQERNIDTYIVPTADFHESEYVGEYFQGRKYLSGFTGSAGILVITREEVGLITDGRYFIQAEAQIKDKGITLYRSGEKDVPDLIQMVYQKTPDKGKVAFDGRVINAKLGCKLEEELKEKDVSIKFDEDLVDIIWRERPKLSFSPIFELKEKYSGKSTIVKVQEVRSKMKEYDADVHILTSLTDIAWLFNLRGDDIPHNPVFMSYSIITNEEIILFMYKGSLDDSIVIQAKESGVEILDYEFFYDYIKINRNNFNKVLVEKGSVNYVIYKLLGDVEIIDRPNPTSLLKSIKNEIEIKNIKNAHIKDGIAVTKFMYWLKNKIGKEEITEISAAEYLYELRREQAGFLDVSFDTISAYKEHAAMMHYFATEESNSHLLADGMLLVDSGGHYMEGSTDITRTIILGDISPEMRLHYTTVVKSMLRLANATFLYGCNGQNLDILARGPIWDLDLDYRSGTGHGIGYLLGVHEPPNGFRWKIVEERNDSIPFETGMITTDEPGIYIEGSHGIRIENELLCIEKSENEYGRFLAFETITYAPIDMDGIDTKYMESSDIRALNDYHKLVFDKISPFLTENERDWLKLYTKEVN